MEDFMIPNLREKFRQSFSNRCYVFSPVQVLANALPWEVTQEFTDERVEALLEMEPVGKPISFKEAYRLRWFELAAKDSTGDWCLLHTRSIRTPLHIWAKERGFYIVFEKGDFEVQTMCV